MVVGVIIVTLVGFNLGPTLPNMEGNCEVMSNCSDDQEHVPTTSKWAVSKLTEYLILYSGQILAILHIVYRIRNAYHSGSTIVLQIALLYIIFTFMLFSFITNSSLRGSDYKAIQDSWYIVFLLIDIPKVTRLAQFVLGAPNPKMVSSIVGRGMYVLAPSFLIDTIGKILLFGLCALTNAHQLVMTAWYACFFNVLNLLVYVSIYPAILALAIELMYSDGSPRWDPQAIVSKLRKSVDSEVQSPVVHRVKVVGIAMLSLIHMLWYWPLLLPSMSSGFIHAAQLFMISNVLTLSVLSVIFCQAYWCLFKDVQGEGQEVLNSLIVFLHKQLDSGIDDSEEMGDSSSCRSDDVELVSSTDEGIGPQADSSSDCSEISMYNKIHAEASTISVASTRASSNKPHSSENAIIEGHERPYRPPRPLAECVKIYKSNPDGAINLTDEEVIQLVEAKYIRGHALEKVLNDHLRGVEVRRKYLLQQDHMKNRSLDSLPYKDYDYELVMGACAESVIGVITLPVGCVGPLILDGKSYHVPMATTEGCLVASTNRGCSALAACGGVTSCLTQDGMTRAPILVFKSIVEAVRAKEWMETPENFEELKAHFDSTSRFARLTGLKITVTGRKLFVRFIAKTGDAMGMNMLSKATEHAIIKLSDIFPEMQVLSLSGNMCTDKKPSAVNWIHGRGKSVVAEATIPADIVEKTLKTTTKDLVYLNINKNLVGSAMAGSIGGNNAHAANIVTAIFIATGQDAAQTVGSSNCITEMEATGEDGRDLLVSVTMPSIEVGTVGGGTVLAAQGTCLEMLGVKGSHPTNPGDNARQLARIICATVLAGELSLMSALAAGHLVRSHLRHNRSSVAVASMSSSSLCSSISDNLCSQLQSRDLEPKRT